MTALIELFCDVDDFLKAFLSESEKHQLAVKKRRRAFTLSPAEIIVGHRLRNLLLIYDLLLLILLSFLIILFIPLNF